AIFANFAATIARCDAFKCLRCKFRSKTNFSSASSVPSTLNASQLARLPKMLGSDAQRGIASTNDAVAGKQYDTCDAQYKNGDAGQLTAVSRQWLAFIVCDAAEPPRAAVV